MSFNKGLLWVAIPFVICGLVLFGLVVTSVDGVKRAGRDFHHQCDSAIGPDPSRTVTLTPTRTSEPEEVPAEEMPEELPSTNPYASITIDPDIRDVPDYYRTCLSVIKPAPHQYSIRTPNSGVAVSCAQRLALEYARGGAGDAAALVRDVVFAASTAAFSGQCAPGTAPAGSDTAPGGCGDPRGPRRTIVLPETVGRQGLCGRRVVASAVTAGDVIFWDYRDHAATRVGIAVSAEEMVTSNPGTGSFFRVAIPDSGGVRVKRVLAGEP